MAYPSSAKKRPSRAVLVLLVLASFTLITLDARGGDNSPLDPLRSAVGNVVGPVETGTSTAVRPFAAVPDFFTSTGRLRRDVSTLRAQNSRLKSELAGSSVTRNQAAELQGPARHREGHRLRAGPRPRRRDGSRRSRSPAP